MSRTPALLAALTATAALLTAAGSSLAAPAPRPNPSGDPGWSAAVSVPAKYAKQSIPWRRCFDTVPDGLPAGSDRLECGTFSAPLDWHHPADGPEVTIAVTRLRPQHGEPAGSVLTNPGGPGGPGRTMPLVFLKQDRRALLDHEEIVGVDVRGTGASSNIDCAGGTDIGSRLDPRDRARDNLSLILDSAELTARFCQDRSGTLGRFVNTEQTVFDLDLLRALLGREKINWVGYSGGTWLGAYYATYFPQRVDRFVLDSNAEFTAGWQESFAWQPLGFERRFREDFLPWTARYDSLYHLGSDPDVVHERYEALRTALAARPVQYPKAGMVDANALDSAVAQALYSRQKFPALAKALATLRKLSSAPPASEFDRATTAGLDDLFAARTVEPRLRPTRSMDASSAVFTAIKCNDTDWQTSRAQLVAESDKQGADYPLLGYGVLGEPCAFWNRPPLLLREPTGEGVPPILMVQDTHDPATPYEGALRAHQNFAGSRMLTVPDQGDHGVYAFGNPCVDTEVERFLVDGVLPPVETSCPGVPLPQPQARSGPAALSSPLDLVQQYTDAAGTFPR